MKAHIHLAEHGIALCQQPLMDDVAVLDVAQWRYNREEALYQLARDGAIIVCPTCVREDRARQLPVRHT